MQRHEKDAVAGIIEIAMQFGVVAQCLTMSIKQLAQFTHRHLTGNGRDLAGHVVANDLIEEIIHDYDPMSCGSADRAMPAAHPNAGHSSMSGGRRC